MYSASSCPFFHGQKSGLRFQLWLTDSRRARGSGTNHMFTSNKQFGIRGMPGDPIQHRTNLGRRCSSLHVASDSGSRHALLYLHCFWNVLTCAVWMLYPVNMDTEKNTAYGHWTSKCSHILAQTSTTSLPRFTYHFLLITSHCHAYTGLSFSTHITLTLHRPKALPSTNRKGRATA